MAIDSSSCATGFNDTRAPRSLWQRSLPIQMLVGLAVGVAVGEFLPDFARDLLPIGQTFIKALKMTVIPLVFCSIALGIFNMGKEISVLGRMIIVAFCYFFAVTGACIVIGLIMNSVFHPGIGADLNLVGSIPANVGLKINLSQFLTDLVPGNIIQSMADQRILQVLLFGVLFGAALTHCGEGGEIVAKGLLGVQLSMMIIVRWIVYLAPLAIAAVIAWLFASQGVSVLVSLVKLVATFYLSLLIVVLLMWTILLCVGENPIAVTRKIIEPLLLAFTTRSSEVTLPIHMEILERMGVSNKVVSTIIPLGYSFNQDGTSLYISLAVAFVVEAHHIALDWHAMLTIVLTGLIATKGMANVGGGGLLAATTVLVALGLPVESIAILAAIDVFMDMGRSAVNVFGNTVAVILVNRFGGTADREISGSYAEIEKLGPA